MRHKAGAGLIATLAIEAATSALASEHVKTSSGSGCEVVVFLWGSGIYWVVFSGNFIFVLSLEVLVEGRLP